MVSLSDFYARFGEAAPPPLADLGYHCHRRFAFTVQSIWLVFVALPPEITYRGSLSGLWAESGHGVASERRLAGVAETACLCPPDPVGPGSAPGGQPFARTPIHQSAWMAGKGGTVHRDHLYHAFIAYNILDSSIGLFGF